VLKIIDEILAQKVMVPEPYTVVQSLPACQGCGSIHPLARKPKLRVEFCPDCGTRVEYGEPRLEKAAIGGITGVLFAVLVGIGKALLKLGRAIQPKKDDEP
jgi:hypothetical protein